MKQCKDYEQDDWKFPEKNIEFYLAKNGLGQYWPCMVSKNYPIIIRDSNPFKTLNAAIKFVEKTITRLKLRS